MNRVFTILLLCAIAALPVKAQVDAQHAVDRLKGQLSFYLSEHPSGNLYLHLDKNIYSPEETIWFKAYLLGDTVTDNKVLYVRIVDEDKEIVLDGQFPMYDIRSHGDLQLPERLAEGKYTLYAYTDRMLGYGDTNVFVQSIRIRKNTGRKLEAEALVRDTAQLVQGGEVQVMARVREDGSAAKSVKGEYELTAGGKTIKYGRLTTNRFGEAFVNFVYPELGDGQSLKVKMLFARDNDYAELSLNLSHEGNPLKVAIHPEGGQLLAGLAGKVAIEVLDIHQNAVETEVLVKNAGQLITKTRTNKQGIATVTLKPEAGSSYTVETTGKKKQLVRFPEVVKPEGYSLKLHRGKGQVIVYNRNRTGSALLMLRSVKEVLWSSPITVPPGDSLTVPVPAADFPKDILSLAVFDEGNRAQSERLFLNKTSEDYKMTISTDLHAYGMQERVIVTLQVADAAGNPVVANLSVAATEKNRIDSIEYRTILQSWHYRPFGQANWDRLQSAGTRGEMDGLLMAIDWDKGHWGTIIDYISHGPPTRLDHADEAIGQTVTKNHPQFNRSSDIKKLKKIDIRSIKNRGSLQNVVQGDVPFINRVPVDLDADKMFSLPASSLLSRKGEEWALDVYEPTGDLNFNFFVQWKDHDIRFDSAVVKGKLLDRFTVVNRFARFSSTEASSFSFEGANQLAEVTIGGKEETVRKALKCMDWVCQFQVLNCKNHPSGTKPIKGNIYYGYRSLITYLGCGRYRDINYIKNITIPEEFLLPDYGTLPHQNQDTRSTVYWNPNIVTDTDGNATFSFYTSDIMGEFEILAQGLEVNTFRPLMGTGEFKVTAK